MYMVRERAQRASATSSKKAILAFWSTDCKPNRTPLIHGVKAESETKTDPGAVPAARAGFLRADCSGVQTAVALTQWTTPSGRSKLYP